AGCESAKATARTNVRAVMLSPVPPNAQAEPRLTATDRSDSEGREQSNVGLQLVVRERIASLEHLQAFLHHSISLVRWRLSSSGTHDIGLAKGSFVREASPTSPQRFPTQVYEQHDHSEAAD